MATMLAARLNVKTHEFGLTEVPVPDPAPDEVRIRVRAAGICLSDVHLIDGGLTPLYNPNDTVTLGHETAGVIDVIGDAVPDGWRVGQRVLLQAGQRCGQCANCVRQRQPCLAVRTRGVDYDGGWAEYALAQHATLVAIPDELPFEQAAIIPDAVATPWSAITTTGHTGPAEAVGVWGVGGLGVHGVQLLRAIGASPIIALDPVPAARARALQFGADLAIDSAAPDLREQVLAATDGHGLDVAFDFAGVPAVREQAATVLALGGRMILVGLTHKALTIANSVQFSYLRQRILGHYGSEPEQVEQLVALARRGRLDFARSISEVLPLAEVEAGVAQMIEKRGNPIRIILRP